MPVTQVPIEGGNSWLDELNAWFLQQAAKAAPYKDEVENALADWMPRMMLLLIPAFALMLELLHAPRYYLQHLIFGFHFHTFVFALMLVLLPLTLGREDIRNGMAVLAVLPYLFLAMKRVYGESFLKTLVKFMALAVGYYLLYSIAMFMVLVLILMQY